jgi:uncharacterized membrane protein YkgB
MALPSHSLIARTVRLSTIDTVAAILGRYGLVIVIGWIGALKFANFEAHQIQPLVAHSPFMGWLYSFLPVYTLSAVLGVFEVAAAVLLAIKPIAPKLSIAGSLMAIVLFIFTVSFLFSTPGVGEPAGGGFPAISLTGEFLLKDIPLLGLSVWTLSDAMRASVRREG